jgi:hypothetical protein
MKQLLHTNAENPHLPMKGDTVYTPIGGPTLSLENMSMNQHRALFSDHARLGPKGGIDSPATDPPATDRKADPANPVRNRKIISTATCGAKATGRLNRMKKMNDPK